MKKLLLLTAVFASFIASAQTTNTDYLNARQRIRLYDWTVNRIQRDTNFVSHYSLPTSQAVKELIEGRLANIGGAGVETDPTFDTKFGNKTTDNLAEGTANKYFTIERARAALGADAPLLFDVFTGRYSVDTFSATGLVNRNRLYKVVDSVRNVIDGNVVHRTGDETIGGNKTYSNNILMNGGFIRFDQPSSIGDALSTILFNTVGRVSVYAGVDLELWAGSGHMFFLSGDGTADLGAFDKILINSIPQYGSGGYGVAIKNLTSNKLEWVPKDSIGINPALAIQNQNASAQTANFKISGNGSAHTFRTIHGTGNSGYYFEGVASATNGIWEEDDDITHVSGWNRVDLDANGLNKISIYDGHIDLNEDVYYSPFAYSSGGYRVGVFNNLTRRLEYVPKDSFAVSSSLNQYNVGVGDASNKLAGSNDLVFQNGELRVGYPSTDMGGYLTQVNGDGYYAGALYSSSSFVSGTSSVNGLYIQNPITPAQITADQNDYSPTGITTKSSLKISSDAARSITGMASQSEGKMLWVQNVGSFNITLKDESASSIAANRFALNGDYTIRPDETVLLIYDFNASQRWRLVGNQSVASVSQDSTALYVQAPLRKVDDSTFAIDSADATHDGYLTKSDWNRFDAAATAVANNPGGGSSEAIEFTKKTMYAEPLPNVTQMTFKGLGNNAFSGTTGTATSRTVTNTDLLSSLPRVGYVSAGTAESDRAGARTNNVYRPSLGFDVILRVSFPTTTSNRSIYMGMMAGTSGYAGYNQPSGNTSSIGVGVDSTDTNWQIMTNDASGTATKYDTEIPVSNSVIYSVRVKTTNGSSYDIIFKDSGGNTFTKTVTTDIPADNSLLNVIWQNQNNKGVIASISSDFYGLHSVSGYGF